MFSNTTVVCGLVLLFAGSISALCRINLETPLDSRTPIVLVNGHTLNPNNRNGDVTFQDGNELQFLCSGTNNYLNNTRIGPLSNATCRNNQFVLHANSQSYNFNNLECHQAPQPDAKEVGTCNLNSKKIQIGFEISRWLFNPKIELCFNAQTLTTYWSKNILQTSPYSSQVGDETSFKKDFFGNVNPGRIYAGSSYDKGHLTPRCDFFTGPDKRMTFYYVNSAPQLKDFNRINWRDLEGVIRTAAYQHGRTLYIYTGTYGFVQNLGGSIPVPQYFWKVVIDHQSGEGVAFVGVNNVTQNVQNPCLARLRCSSVLWLGQNFVARMSDIRRGQIYCCTVPIFRSIQNIQIPNFSEYRGGVLRSF